MNTETIKERLKIIADLQKDLNSANEQYKDVLEENPIYQEVKEEEQEVKQEVKEKKEKVMENPQIKEYKTQIKEIRDDIKEHKRVLAQELAEYFKESGNMEIVDAEGNTKRMVFSVKLVDIN
jgi:uncharacterized protein involved in exopolysaccharide biosynthesis